MRQAQKAGQFHYELHSGQGVVDGLRVVVLEEREKPLPDEGLGQEPLSSLPSCGL